MGCACFLTCSGWSVPGHPPYCWLSCICGSDITTTDEPGVDNDTAILKYDQDVGFYYFYCQLFADEIVWVRQSYKLIESRGVLVGIDNKYESLIYHPFIYNSRQNANWNKASWFLNDSYVTNYPFYAVITFPCTKEGPHVSNDGTIFYTYREGADLELVTHPYDYGGSASGSPSSIPPQIDFSYIIMDNYILLWAISNVFGAPEWKINGLIYSGKEIRIPIPANLPATIPVTLSIGKYSITRNIYVNQHHLRNTALPVIATIQASSEEQIIAITATNAYLYVTKYDQQTGNISLNIYSLIPPYQLVRVKSLLSSNGIYWKGFLQKVSNDSDLIYGSFKDNNHQIYLFKYDMITDTLEIYPQDISYSDYMVASYGCIYKDYLIHAYIYWEEWEGMKITEIEIDIYNRISMAHLDYFYINDWLFPMSSAEGGGLGVVVNYHEIISICRYNDYFCVAMKKVLIVDGQQKEYIIMGLYPIPYILEGILDPLAYICDYDYAVDILSRSLTRKIQYGNNLPFPINEKMTFFHRFIPSSIVKNPWLQNLNKLIYDIETNTLITGPTLVFLPNVITRPPWKYEKLFYHSFNPDEIEVYTFSYPSFPNSWSYGKAIVNFNEAIQSIADTNTNFIFLINQTNDILIAEKTLYPSSILCKADFYIDKSYGPPPLEVSFTNISSGQITSFEWDFGDGTVDTTTWNPTHIYSEEGVYTAKLTVSNTYNTDTMEWTIIVAKPNSPFLPRAKMIVNPKRGTAPLTVYVDDLSEGVISRRKLDFGDGTSALRDYTQFRQTHIYNSSGLFKITLTVSDGEEIP